MLGGLEKAILALFSLPLLSHWTPLWALCRLGTCPLALNLSHDCFGFLVLSPARPQRHSGRWVFRHVLASLLGLLLAR